MNSSNRCSGQGWSWQMMLPDFKLLKMHEARWAQVLFLVPFFLVCLFPQHITMNIQVNSPQQ